MPPLLAPVVLFDLDGTLTDSAPGILASLSRALAAVGRDLPGHDVLDTVVGPPMRVNLARLGLAGEELETALAAYFAAYEAGGWADNEVFPGIAELLADLVGHGARLAVATSKAQRFADRILGHFDLARHFEFVGAASDDGARLAKADVVAHTLGALGTADAVMVGDRVHDVDGAAAHGLDTVAVGWGYGSAAEHAGARWRVGAVGELRALLVGGGS